MKTNFILQLTANKLKLNLVKRKIFFLGVLSFILLFCLSFTTTNSIEEGTLFTTVEISDQSEEPAFYVAVAWEYFYSGSGKGQPVVSNVVYVKCEWHNARAVSSSLSKYYDAFYRKNRETTGLERPVCFRFDTRDEAESKRRELIASYNWNWNPLLIERFTHTCD